MQMYCHVKEANKDLRFLKIFPLSYVAMGRAPTGICREEVFRRLSFTLLYELSFCLVYTHKSQYDLIFLN